MHTLGAPQAALFGGCLAWVADHMVVGVMAAGRSGHGAESMDQALSLYYVAHDIAPTSHGMLMAMPDDAWRVVSSRRPAALVARLREVVQQVHRQA